MESQKRCQYSIFKTRWGWFGILGNEKGLLRTCLPIPFKEAVEQRLLSGTEGDAQAKNAYRDIEKQVLSYYEGRRVDFSDVPVCLDDLTSFQRKVLTALRTIRFGKTVSYGELARMVKKPKASRAIGTVMARNPLPLIIPCHRIIKQDGSLGHFSAAGGSETKKRMLDLEKWEK